MTIGERISALRSQKSISQGQLARALGVSRQAVSKWENDQASPDTRNLIQIAEVLDTEVEYLATGTHPVYEPAPVVVNVVEKVDRVIEKVVEKPVIKRVIRIKYRQNPLYLALAGLLGLALGILIGTML